MLAVDYGATFEAWRLGSHHKGTLKLGLPRIGGLLFLGSLCGGSYCFGFILGAPDFLKLSNRRDLSNGLVAQISP